VISALGRRQKQPVSPKTDGTYDILALVAAALIVLVVVTALTGGLLWEFRRD
jgi:hypothetical protein